MQFLFYWITQSFNFRISLHIRSCFIGLCHILCSKHHQVEMQCFWQYPHIPLSFIYRVACEMALICYYLVTTARHLVTTARHLLTLWHLVRSFRPKSRHTSLNSFGMTFLPCESAAWCAIAGLLSLENTYFARFSSTTYPRSMRDLQVKLSQTHTHTHTQTHMSYMDNL